jgi:peptidoglycan/LPS O-acetylase OafA/YrhL
MSDPAGKPAPAASLHLQELDVLRGAAILAVVYLHAYFSPWDVTPHRDKTAMHVIHLFAHAAVPMFLFSSGLLMARERPAPFGEFARKKWLRIGVPLLFWMAAAFVYRAWRSDGWGDGTLWKDAALFNVSGQFYYLFVLAFFYVAFFPVRSWAPKRLGWLAAAALLANLATIAWYESSTISGDFATLAYRNPFTWAFFFAFGMYAGKRRENLEWTCRLIVPGLFVMAGLLAAYVIQGERWDYPVSYFSVVGFLFSGASLVVYPALVLTVASSAGRAVLVPFRALGRYAFAIYLVHMPFFIGYVTTELVSDSPAKDDYWQLMNAIFAVGFVTSLAFVAAVGWAWPWGARVLLGIEPRRA